MGYIGYHMLVGTDTCGQNFGNVRIGQGRKTPVYTTCRGTRPVSAHITQSIDKCKDPVFVIKKQPFIVTGLNIAEGHCRPVGKP